jgi:hypothetical protein
MDRAKGEAPEPEMVSRKTQKSIGLLTGTVVYGTAIGGLFGLVFAYSYGRSRIARSRVLSALLAGIGFVTIVLVPNLKYPANHHLWATRILSGSDGAFSIALSIIAMALASDSPLFPRSLWAWNSSLRWYVLHLFCHICLSLSAGD